MSEIKTVKKKIEYNEDEYDMYSDGENEQEYIDTNDDIDDEYFNETVQILRRELLRYIENKSLTIGEYLSINATELYLTHKLNL